ncbi:hypothetical protein SAMN06273572_106116 [Monaibacterium marinum]|uniref:Uncharacterized protein n=1 Tax=Pontivivens marinum TaxID=1690039 RepID=A0A2C9CV23_9RHOB|nr:hypothetical protein [Monaibacterium marinum]SOH94965.1 hypothetical protein SAMN06273572_106116 [Monaibacterium marinum]
MVEHSRSAARFDTAPMAGHHPKIAQPVFECKYLRAINGRLGLIPGCTMTSASHANGRMLSAAVSKKNEAWLPANGLFNRDPSAQTEQEAGAAGEWS